MMRVTKCTLALWRVTPNCKVPILSHSAQWNAIDQHYINEIQLKTAGEVRPVDLQKLEGQSRSF
jgi:hypothetical protein